MTLVLKTYLKRGLIAGLILSASTAAYSLNFDGSGHYALRGETLTMPAASTDRGMFQAVRQSFFLLGEARLHDKSSFFLGFRLFDNSRESWLGDSARPRECEAGRDEQCSGSHQSVREPGYLPYIPKVTEAYAQYAFDHCILEAGRRSRHWGLGIFLDNGRSPFSPGASIYDGISCDINLQKAQALGFSFGFDKLSETGSPIRDHSDLTFGPTNPHDDIDQLFLTIVYDDRKSNAGSLFTKQIGIYGSRIASPQTKRGGSNTDLTFVDLYTGFYYGPFTLKNEVLFTLGKTADPNMVTLGGSYQDLNDEHGIATNKLNSIAFAGEFFWKLASSGHYIGPEEYRQGDASSHNVFLRYAFAPGDADGYFDDKGDLSSAAAGSRTERLNVSHRDKNASAVSFHRNYRPALILFNGSSQTDDLRIDGIFDPGRVMNTQLYSLGYRYEDLILGNFEIRGIYANLNKSMPSDIKDFYRNEAAKPVGYYGNNLGFELDLAYEMSFGKDASIGLAAGALLPGKAWQLSDDQSVKNSYLLQSHITFYF
ncbi:MAG: hypothetical protein H6618_07485 [Deltaproteobacteria bacterium]|nr:hypothetical protein [Deltaproteobacteria bacterium]